VPTAVSRRANTPRERVGERKRAGPERTVTLCEDWLRQRQVTTVPGRTVSRGPSWPRTKALSTMLIRGAARVPMLTGASAVGAVDVGSGGLAGAGLVGALTSVVVPARRLRAKTPRLRSVLPGARSGASEVKASTLPSAESDGSVTEPLGLATCSTAPSSRRRTSTWLRAPRTTV